MYLIMKCEEGFEYGVEREPVQMVEDWEKWYVDNKPKFHFEVYEVINNHFKMVKDYETPMESGMALCFWNDDDDCYEVSPTVVYTFPKMTRNDNVPSVVKKLMKNVEDDWNSLLKTCGEFSWSNNGRYYVYGEYNDQRYSRGY